ncbi:GCN5 family acetyltransferase [Sinorhizobium americanum]|uniref:GCN5 family acetyltransferase n=3 Tax=Sinorhizobium/Ensifer group TaxID=227292 RepID=A0A2S3YN78_9HYPH|nr:GCN5-related N-acetyltransferase protein [Sinorhizobium fredii]PDT42567.1 GNAT family N-acetyltransferase [Sinorhizobium sp. FG01]PDT55377.1 GNAT family N-acetyltransferase [Sinorhizobium sp. NG07B]POH30488.1 GCN5 family acetyltransferase [Sinorhizobium americanum]POH32418.1 GCN5 family acetyltransferase [Sinorhizobium americanum]
MNSACAAQVRCRDATLADMKACADIFNRWVDATVWMPRIHGPADVERYYRETLFAKGTVIIIAESRGEIAGFLALAEEQFVSALYLDPSYRGAGIGAALLSEAKRRAKGELKLWTFAENARAQRFYERQGFVPIRRTSGDNEEGLPDILYLWRAEPLSGGGADA